MPLLLTSPANAKKTIRKKDKDTKRNKKTTKTNRLEPTLNFQRKKQEKHKQGQGWARLAPKNKKKNKKQAKKQEKQKK